VLIPLRFPGQEHVVGSTKIPSVIYYDRQGRMKAAGAEADTSAAQARAEDEGWIKAELFVPLSLSVSGNRILCSTVSNFVYVPARCVST
jgi:hypothetical protein